MCASRCIRAITPALFLALSAAGALGAATVDPPSWSALDPSGPLPSARDGISPIFDFPRKRMIVYGGGGAYTDVWALDLSAAPAWSRLLPSGAPPPGRAYAAAIFDSARDRMIVFGGNSSGGTRLNDVWALALAGEGAWSPILPLGTPPDPRANHSAILDPVRDRVIVFGGVTTTSLLNDVWALDLSGPPAWTRIVPAGTPPSPRSFHSAIFDPIGDRMVVFGGTGRNDVWALSLSGIPTWAQVSPAGPLPHGRFGHSAFFHPGRASMILFGGGYPTLASEQSLDYQVFNDSWELSLAGGATWNAIAPSGALPAGRLNHGAVYDPVFDRMVVFAGETEGTNFLDDSWALTWGEPVLGVAGAPAPFRIRSSFPNPFRGVVRLGIDLARDADVRLTACDLQGRAVSRIFGGRLRAGFHELAWRGADDRGHRLAGGVYWVRLEAEGHTAFRKCVLAR